MKILTATLALSLGCCAAAAFAEGEANTPFDPRWAAQEQEREAYINQQRAEAYDRAYAPGRGYARDRSWRDDPARLTDRDECWNPRARHFEGVRPGERQDDLDFSRCRPKAEDGRSYRWR